LLPFIDSGFENNSFAGLNVFSVDDILECAAQLGENISADDVALFLETNMPSQP